MGIAAVDLKNLCLVFRDLMQECRHCRRLIVQPLFRFQENAKYRENNIYEKLYVQLLVNKCRLLELSTFVFYDFNAGKKKPSLIVRRFLAIPGCCTDISLHVYCL